MTGKAQIDKRAEARKERKLERNVKFRKNLRNERKIHENLIKSTVNR